MDACAVYNLYLFQPGSTKRLVTHPFRRYIHFYPTTNLLLDKRQNASLHFDKLFGGNSLRGRTLDQ